MLQFLQTGKVLYVLAVVCGLGMISKLVTSSLYKRLIKETGNMALTTNKNLKTLKQRLENTFVMNHGVRNANAYIERQVYSFRCLRLPLDLWDNLSVQAMLICFLIGGLAAFGAYWYRCDSYYMVLYGTMGILSGLFLVLVDNGTNISAKRQQLTDCLVDYVENSPHFYRQTDRPQNHSESEKRQTSTERDRSSRPTARDLGRRGRRLAVVANAGAGTGAGVTNMKATVKSDQTNDFPDPIQPEPDETLTRSMDQLKQSLAQIAASREQSQQMLEKRTPSRPTESSDTKRPTKELKSEDIEAINNFLKNYMM